MECCNLWKVTLQMIWAVKLLWRICTIFQHFIFEEVFIKFVHYVVELLCVRYEIILNTLKRVEMNDTDSIRIIFLIVEAWGEFLHLLKVKLCLENFHSYRWDTEWRGYDEKSFVNSLLFNLLFLLHFLFWFVNQLRLSCWFLFFLYRG